MIGKITKGRSTYGLLNYILGPGKSDEHRDPDIIAGSGQLAEMFSRRRALLDLEGRPGEAVDYRWEPLDIFMLAQQLDRHYKARVELDHHDARGDRKPSRAERSPQRQPHVYHVSLSIPAEDGSLSRERWAEISRDYIKRMGLDQCEWGAFPHGESLRGNDHVHLVVNLVQRDGQWANIRKDFVRNKQVCRDLERDYGLRIVQGHQLAAEADADQTRSGSNVRTERGLPGYLLGEDRRRSTDPLSVEEAQRTFESAVGSGQFAFVSATRADDGKVRITTRREPQRVTLERLTRIAATAASTEADFVSHLRRMGIWVRPRFGAGGTERVAGYSVSTEPWPGRERIWFGGGKLAPDLTLPELRKRWADSPEERATARAVWVGQQPNEVPTADWDQRRQRDWEQRILRNLHQAERDWRDLDDRSDAARQSAASDTAGLLGAAAWRLNNQELAAASRDLARNAQGYDGIAKGQPVHHPSLAQAVRLMVNAGGPYELTGWLAVLKQIRRLAEATADAHQARGELIQAQRAADVMTQRLDVLTASLEDGGLSSTEIVELRQASRLAELGRGTGEPGQATGQTTRGIGEGRGRPGDHPRTTDQDQPRHRTEDT